MTTENTKRYSIVMRVALIVIALAAIFFCLVVAIFYYSMWPGVINHYGKPLTVEQARQLKCPIPLPDSAKNVRFGFAYGGMQAFEILVRFEAPVEVCRTHIQLVIDAHAAQEHEKPYTAYLHLLNSTPESEKSGMFGEGQTSWFDVEKIVHGETDDDPRGYDGQQLWIDDDRGVFYYKITD